MKRILFFALTLALASLTMRGQNIVPKAPAAHWENPTGPYQVVMEVDETLPEHTVYRPADLSAFPSRDKLPIIVMSGPGCDYDGDSYRPFWTELASYGYLIVAVGPPVPEGTRAPMFYNKPKDMLAGLDWAFKENDRQGSKYYHKIDTEHVVLMGQSCGGSLVSKLALDSRVTLITMWNSGVLPYVNGPARMQPRRDGRLVTSDPDLQGNAAFLKELKVPIAFFVGENDMLRPNSLYDFNQVEGVPAFFAVRDIPGDAHGGTFREMNGGAWGEAGVAWVNWWCKDDQEAALLFKGAPCGLEKSSPKWVEVRKKNIDFAGPDGRTEDWAGMRRYDAANAALTQAPELVLMGDSITDNWDDDDPAYFEQNPFVGRGISGQTASQMLVRFRRDVVDLHPKAVAIMAGTNDLCQQMASMAYYPDDAILGNTISMCELAEAAGIKVILCSVTPCAHYMPIPDQDAGSRIVALNAQLKAYADSHKNVTYLDYFTPLANAQNGFDPEQSADGIHPYATVYRQMEQMLNETVAKVLKTKNNYYVISEEDARKATDAKRTQWEEMMRNRRTR